MAYAGGQVPPTVQRVRLLLQHSELPTDVIISAEVSLVKGAIEFLNGVHNVF